MKFVIFSEEIHDIWDFIPQTFDEICDFLCDFLMKFVFFWAIIHQNSRFYSTNVY